MIKGGSVTLLSTFVLSGVNMVKFGNLSDEFKAGAQAYSDGISKTKGNPYTFKSREWEDWGDGYSFCKAVAVCLLMLKDGHTDHKDHPIQSIYKDGGKDEIKPTQLKDGSSNITNPDGSHNQTKEVRKTGEPPVKVVKPTQT